MDEMKRTRLATGCYMNFFNDVGDYDIFIIFNEGNTVRLQNMEDVEDIEKKIELIDDLLRDKIDKMTDEEICETLDPILEYGIQIIRNK